MELITILEILWRRRWLVIGAGLAGFLGVIFIAWIIHPTYEAIARVNVGTSDTLASFMAGVGLESKRQSGASTVGDNYDTEILQATLHPILVETVEKLQLKDRWGREPLDPFDLVDSSLLNKILPQPYVEVERYEESSILEITAECGDGKQAALIADTIAGLFISDRIAKRTAEFKTIKEFVQAQADAARNDYVKALSAIQEFMKREGTLSTADSAQRLTTLQEELNESIIALSKTAVDYSPDHPDYKMIEKQIDILRKMIDEEVSKQSTQYTEYAQLDAAASNARTIYQTLLSYHVQVCAAEKLAISSIRFEQRAPVPSTKSFPRKLIVTVVSVLLGAFAALGAGFTYDFMDPTIKNPAEVRSADNTLPLLGVIPCSGALSRLSGALADPRSAAYEAFRATRDTIERVAGTPAPRVLAVTSSYRNEGKTVVAANIGRALAATGRQVLLVDLNLRKPGLSTVFGLNAAEGIAEVLAKGKPIMSSIVRTKTPGLDILPAGTVQGNAADLLDSKRAEMKAAFAELARSYDCVVVDTPPAVAVTDALAVVAHADAVVMVARAFRVSLDTVRNTAGAISTAGGKPIGIVLNRARMQLFGYRTRKYPA